MAFEICDRSLSDSVHMFVVQASGMELTLPI